MKKKKNDKIWCFLAPEVEYCLATALCRFADGSARSENQHISLEQKINNAEVLFKLPLKMDPHAGPNILLTKTPHATGPFRA